MIEMLFYMFPKCDVDKLFTPEDARSKDDRSTMQSLIHEYETSDKFSPIIM